MIELVRRGYVAAKRTHSEAPSETPKRAARSDPAASHTAWTSSIRVSSVGRADSGTRSESPVPRLSNRISREKLASRSKKRAIVGSSQAASTWETQPGTQTRSRGPSPTTWYAIETPSGAFAYRVVGATLEVWPRPGTVASRRSAGGRPLPGQGRQTSAALIAPVSLTPPVTRTRPSGSSVAVCP